MTVPDRYLLVRAGAVYLAVMLTAVVWVWRRPDRRTIGAAFLATMWNVPAVLALELVAAHAGWWTFDADGGLFLGVPVDLYLAWVWLWGAIAALAFPSMPLALVAIIALAADLVLMPAAAPVLRLGPAWLLGEAAGLLIGLIPGQLLARWTVRGDRLAARACFQVAAFSGLILFVLPAVVIAGTRTLWRNPLTFPAWQLSLIAQALAIPAIVGLSAVQEFVTRGGGTPVPFDAPRRLVTTGVYAYVRNPMQLSAVVLLILIGAVVKNGWIAAAGAMAHIYSAGLAGWNEDADLRARFGDGWLAYRAGVKSWVARWRPWQPANRPASRLFVAAGCGMCREVGAWFAARGAIGLTIVPAESHPSGALTRITYEASDGSGSVAGVEAIARALEHVHLGWALVGCVVRLPIARPLFQLLADASGAEARTLPAIR